MKTRSLKKVSVSIHLISGSSKIDAIAVVDVVVVDGGGVQTNAARSEVLTERDAHEGLLNKHARVTRGQTSDDD